MYVCFTLEPQLKIIVDVMGNAMVLSVKERLNNCRLVENYIPMSSQDIQDLKMAFKYF